MRIMIVDDSKNMRQIVSNALDSLSGTELFFAGNGEEAEGILQENRVMGTPIDLIFLDWMMPKMSGFEFLKKIRGTEFFAETPRIIMLTAETYSEQMNACLKYGVSLYVTKPFTKDEILAAIKKVENEAEGMKHAV
jgi:two-component system chemotaxis response regulator CheY